MEGGLNGLWVYARSHFLFHQFHPWAGRFFYQPLLCFSTSTRREKEDSLSHDGATPQILSVVGTEMIRGRKQVLSTRVCGRFHHQGGVEAADLNKHIAYEDIRCFIFKFPIFQSVISSCLCSIASCVDEDVHALRGNPGSSRKRQRVMGKQ